MNRPRIFISAVSGELGSARAIVAKVLGQLGYDHVSMDDWSLGYGELQQWLVKQIDTCEGLIQLTGDAYGAEPRKPDAIHGRISYTQFELLYARDKKKKIWVIRVDRHYPRDTPLSALDLPSKTSMVDASSYQAERRELQLKYITLLRSLGLLSHPTTDPLHLENLIRKLRDDLLQLHEATTQWLRADAESKTEIRRQLRAQPYSIWLAVSMAVIVLVVVLYALLPAGSTSISSEHKLREYLVEKSEAEFNRIMVSSDTISAWQNRQELRLAAREAHNARLLRINQLVADFKTLESTKPQNETFREMLRIIGEKGVDDAIAYVESQRLEILSEAHREKAQASSRLRSTLLPLLKTVALHRSAGNLIVAGELLDSILALDNTWQEAQQEHFQLLIAQGDYALSHSTLSKAEVAFQEALVVIRVLRIGPAYDYLNQQDLALGFNRLGDISATQGQLDYALAYHSEAARINHRLVSTYPDSIKVVRRLGTSLNRLGDVLVIQERFEEALAKFTEALRIREDLEKKHPGSLEIKNEVGISYDRLGDVMEYLDRLPESLYYRRAKLAESLYLSDVDSSNLEWRRNVMIVHNKLGNLALRFAENMIDEGKSDTEIRQQFKEARTRFGLGLGIARSLLALDSSQTENWRDVSISYSRLGDVALWQDSVLAAKEWYEKSVAIDENLVSIDSTNTDWQRDLSISYRHYSQALDLSGHHESALGYARRSCEIAMHLTRLDTAGRWRSDLRDAEEWLSSLSHTQGRN